MSLRFALLGMLSIRPMSGYDLKKYINASVSHFWSADQSQIYRTLSALVEEGAAERSTIEQEDRPNLHLHRLTPAGEKALDDWLESPLETEVTREPFLARIFFADRLPVPKTIALLQARRAEIAEQLAALSIIEAAESRTSLADVLRFATLDNGIAHARTELTWIDNLISQLTERAQ